METGRVRRKSKIDKYKNVPPPPPPPPSPPLSEEESLATVEEPFYYDGPPRRCRTILYLMIFTGVVVMYIYSSDVNIIIVTCNLYNGTSKTNITFMNGTVYHWKPNEEYILMSIFYAGFTISQVFCVLLLGKIHMKICLGLGHITAGGIKFIYNLITADEIIRKIVFRFMEGLATGVFYPMVYQCLPVWVPVQEHSFFVSTFEASNLGIAITYCLYTILRKHVHHTSMFYTSGILGLLWGIIWLSIISNRPEKCKYIRKDELDYIQAHTSKVQTYTLVPWYCILKCPTVIGLGLSAIGRKLIYAVFMIFSPIYVVRFEKEEQFELWISPPFMISFLISFFCIKVRRGIFLSPNGQRILIFFSQIVPGSLVIFLGLYDYNNTILFVVFYVVIILSVHTNTSAVLESIAPAFSIHISAYIKTLHLATPFLSVMLTKYLLGEELTKENFQTVFLWTGIICVITAIPYAIFVKLHLRTWNFYGSERHSIYAEHKTNQVYTNIEVEDAYKATAHTNQTRGTHPDWDEPNISDIERRGTLRLSREVRRSQLANLHKLKAEERKRTFKR